MEWTDGMLYPVLHRLERLGLVEARWEVATSGRRRKYYGITPRGRAQLDEEHRQWQAVDETLRGIWRALSLPDAAGEPVPLQTCRGALVQDRLPDFTPAAPQPAVGFVLELVAVEQASPPVDRRFVHCEGGRP